MITSNNMLERSTKLDYNSKHVSILKSTNKPTTQLASQGGSTPIATQPPINFTILICHCHSPTSIMDRFLILFTTILAVTVITARCQISTPCTTSMIASFTPCVNYITGSSANGRSPTSNCCKAVESLMSTSMECTCLIVTGNVPFSLPSAINQALAITLPQACNSESVPIQCKCNML